MLRHFAQVPIISLRPTRGLVKQATTGSYGAKSPAAAHLLARNGYRGEVARKSRNRSAPASARTAARRAQAGVAPVGPAHTGTAQLTAPAATGAGLATAKDTEEESYPGQQFGLPESGPGSVASLSRRVLALFIDWLLSMAIAYWLTHSQFWTIVVFAAEVFLLTALGGITAGKRVMGIRVIRTDGGPVWFARSLVRTLILLTVVLPLLTDYDRRGIHDRAAGTIVVRI
jgi:RDD family